MSERKTLLDRCEAVLAGVQWLSIFTASIALVILIVTFGWLVFGRYVLNVTPTWVEQLALVLICYIAFLGAATGVKDETHLGVSMFREMLPERIQKVVVIAIDFILAGFGAVMLIAGSALMKFGSDSMIPMLNVPESTRTFAITLCGGLIFLHATLRGITRVVRFSNWTPIFDLKES